MKKLIAVVSCAALMCCVALAGCAGNDAAEETQAQGENTQIANPWIDAADAAEAVEFSGIEFDVDETLDAGVGEPFEVTYRAMEGLVEVTYDNAANQVIVRKGDPSLAEGGDISGDYGEYPLEWTMQLDSDVEATCYGYVEDAAAKTVWTDDGYAYSILAIPLGGDDEFGLSAQSVEAYADTID
ncbi:Uncharacterised protein [Slackia heliotrinireducens]|uniref:Uncharacterized protein n=1 Tax=Slackia heliotrinireducens (strain ATCC 29202 / DSM 20476 / NCTC 11029 / RHS 1) TaxID=471855 RepID=C7N709_SLAHD|nr:hypothetical protein [Slackia heliotrinireducens]ACV22694.1 hypothetical protein Shel_16750 [Slackia heliotrinireducens DSM 20476]VEH01294.1 Uncharacterised protein [Slackia heliotrinireducens]